MPEVAAFQISGVKCWFWSLDHEPPHFHAKKRGEWELKVFFLMPAEEMIEIEWADRKPSSRQIKTLRHSAATHRADLLAQWDEIHPC